MAAARTVAVLLACFVTASEASAEEKPFCAKGTCTVAGDNVMLQKMAIHRGILQTKGRGLVDRSFDLSSDMAEAAYAAQLYLTVLAAHAYRGPAIDEIEQVIDNLVVHQAKSQQNCGAQLKGAKDHLNKLHDSVDDLATHINSTQAAIKPQQFFLAAKQEEEAKANEWKEEQKKRCANEKEDRKETLKVLKEDLADLKQIGAQSNATAAGALLEESALERKPFPDIHSLVLVAKSAAAALAQKCHMITSRAQLGVSLIEAPKGTPTPDECHAAKKTLEDSVAKPFVELTRQVAENEDLLESTSCEDTVHEEFKNKIAPIQKDKDKFASKIQDATTKLSELRPRLNDGHNSRKRLEEQVDKLGEECASLPQTMKDLDKIKEVIKVMDKCPGLEEVKIKIPTWIGEWVTLHQNDDETDEILDVRLNDACTEAKGVQQPVRAAEVGEILARSVVGMPSTNTAKQTVIGACPNCAGHKDILTGLTHAAGHARVGWDAGAAFSEDTKSKSLSTGMRAVLCVRDAAKEGAKQR